MSDLLKQAEKWRHKCIELKERVHELENPWTKVRDGLPDTGKRVSVLFENKQGYYRRALAEYVAKRTILQEDFISDEYEDFVDRDEENDIDYAPEGWYEYNFESEISMHMTMKVTHWMKQPKLPEATP